VGDLKPCSPRHVEKLLAGAAAADGLTRIDYRDPIAECGEPAIRRLEPWLADPRLAAFAVVTIVRTAQMSGSEALARTTLIRARTDSSPAVQGDIDRALHSLVRNSRRHPARSSPGPKREATRSLASDPPPPLRRLVGTWLSNGRPSQPPREWHQRDWIRKLPAYRDVYRGVARSHQPRRRSFGSRWRNSR